MYNVLIHLISFILYNDFKCQVDSMDRHYPYDIILRWQQENKNHERFGKVLLPCPFLLSYFLTFCKKTNHENKYLNWVNLIRSTNLNFSIKFVALAFNDLEVSYKSHVHFDFCSCPSSPKWSETCDSSKQNT